MHLDSWLNHRLTRMRLVPLLAALLFVSSLASGRADQQQQQQVTVKKLLVPAIVDPRADKLVMHCDYELRGKLYSVNWYKLDKMLFRYAPNLSQKATVFPHEFVKVSLQESNARQLVLLGHGDYRKNKRAYEGTFICEVSVDHTFSTGYAVANVSVAVLPEDKPRIEGVAQNYQAGEQLDAACTSMPSLPPAELSFYMNGQKVDKPYVRRETPATAIDDGSLASTKLLLAIKLQRRHFKSGILALECRARLPNVPAAAEYKTTRKIGYEPNNQRLAHDALRNEAAVTRVASVAAIVVVMMLIFRGW